MNGCITDKRKKRLSIIKKIAIIGPESTGKSTLSEAMAEALHTVWVPEYAREYLKMIDRPYIEDDLVQIARGQVASEDKAASGATHYLVCDTDLNVVKVWSEHKYGQCHPWILEEIASRKYDLYLLTDIDIPWEHDPMREHPDAAMRQYFYNIYKDIVLHSGVPWVNISGDADQRLNKAMDAVKLYLG